MVLAVFSFFVFFLLIASGGLLLFYRAEIISRLSAVVAPEGGQRGFRSTLRETRSGLRGLAEQAERILPKSQAEVSVVQRRMIRAGIRSETAVKISYGVKVLLPLVLCLLVAVSGLARHSSFIIYIAALGVGFLLPDFWLGRRIAIRQKEIRRGLPDVLDLLVICVEAGLGIDQATARAAEELRLSQPAISDELGVIVLEQRAGRPRSDAWRNFADRCAVDSVRNLVAVLAQSEQFGTSIAKTLRVHSETLRTQRRQRVEEQAAKTSVKLVFPLVFFIFPSLFLVTLGPAIIVIMESFNKYLK
jgi:tight adherence protein C